MVAGCGGPENFRMKTSRKTKVAKKLDETTEIEKKRLQGTWEAVSVHRDGTPVPEQIGATVTVAGDREAAHTLRV